MAINLVWLKRDIRLADHQPIQQAIANSIAEQSPLVLLYIFEEMLLNDPHYSTRHWRFVYQSLLDVARQLPEKALWITHGNAIDVIDEIHKHFQINTIYSHEEIGLENTYIRDQQVSAWCQQHQISWQQSQLGAVQRGLINRVNWDKHWADVMRAPIQATSFAQVTLIPPDNNLLACDSNKVNEQWLDIDENFQLGGESQAMIVANSFFAERGKSYSFSLSSPSLSRAYCSRLSPYLAWGNISLRQVYQTLLAHWQKPGWRRSLSALSSRLHWHCHFIQKFESEHRIEHEAINRGYENMPRDNSEAAQVKLSAWKTGNTGYPMVDACMRCLLRSGYVNFRMRAMLVSFLSHHLHLDWRLGVQYLASLFLDFEPGIHYSQFQMQAGITGINTIRVYNPVKQSQEKDTEGAFIKAWLPELAHIPAPIIHEPWLMTEMEQMMYGLKLGQDYPLPIVDIKSTGKQARELLWQWRNKAQVKQESYRILARHVRPD
ncbi:deoxyribodipyrimidine photo-lyase/cryptochrome family protein [Colwelliaceae bacterium MEBiC 14330]